MASRTEMEGEQVSMKLTGGWKRGCLLGMAAALVLTYIETLKERRTMAEKSTSGGTIYEQTI